MIDTIKLKIPIELPAYKKLTELCEVHVGFRKIPLLEKQIKYVITKTAIELGSFNRLCSVRIPKEFIEGSFNYIFIELSLPKVYFAHNVRLLTMSQFQEVILEIHKKIKEHYKITAPISDWEVMRIDLCYNWKFKSKKEFEQTLKILQNLKYPRKKKYNYDTSVMFQGSSYTVKFYSKYDEFMKHDFTHMIKEMYKPEFIDEITELAKNVLRFEVTIRRKHFKTVFNSKVLRISDITEERVLRTLQNYLKKLIKLVDIDTSKKMNAYDKLVEMYGEIKGRDIYEKYRMFTSEDPTDREVFNSYSYPNRYKFTKHLENAGVGLLSEDLKYQVNLTIPSENAVF